MSPSQSSTKKISLLLLYEDWSRLAAEQARLKLRDGRRPSYTEILLKFIRKFPKPEVARN